MLTNDAHVQTRQQFSDSTSTSAHLIPNPSLFSVLQCEQRGTIV